MPKKFFVILWIGFAFNYLNAQETTYYTHDEADYFHALELYHNKAYVAAQHAFKEISSNYDEFSEMRANCDYYVANCAVRLGDQNADELVTDFVDKYPNSTKRNDAFMEVATYYYNTGKYAHALKWLQRVKHKNMPQRAYEDFLFKYGYALFATNNLSESKKYFVQLVDSPDYGAQAKYYYGFVAYEQDDYENADKYLGEVAQESEYKKDVSYYMADMNFKLGKFQQAIDAGLPLINTAAPAERSEINKIVGESYFNLEQYGKAIPYLKEYKGKQGKWTNTDYYLLGYSYYKQNDFPNAIAQFNKIIDGNNAVAQNAYYHLAECYLKTNKKSEALNAFRNASQMSFKPQIQEDAYLNYAKLSYEIGNPYKNVAEVLQDFLKAYPNSVEKEHIKKLIISAYVVSKDYAGALQYLESEKQNKQNSIYQKVAYERGVQLFKEARYHEAGIHFDKSLTNPVDAEYTARATYWKGETAFQLNEYTDALRSYINFQNLPASEVLEEGKNIDYQIAYTYFKQKEYTKAAESFNRYVKKANTDAEKLNDAYLRLGDTYFVTSAYQKAVDAYLKSIDLNSKTADYATFQAAVSYGFVQNNNQKITLLNKVVNSYPNSSYKDDALYVMGTTYTSMNQPNKAIESYDKLIKDLPNSSFVPRALLKKGLIYYNENQIEEALKTFKLAVKNYPNTPIAQEAVQNARQIYIDTGRVDEYASWVKDLSFVNVTDAELDHDMYESAEKQFVTGDNAKAVVSFKKYLQSYPNGLHALPAHFYLAQALESIQKQSETIPHYQYVANQPQSEFTEQALVKLSQMYLNADNWTDATPVLLKLEQVADHSQNVLYAQSNLMKSYYNKGNYAQAVIYADKVLKSSELDAKVKADAQIIIARSAFKTQDFDKARSSYKLVESVASGELKAEALFYDAYFKNQDGDYKNSNVVVQKIAADYAAYKYWGAKGLVVMAQNFYGLKDAYQATYILESVIKNFTQFEDVVAEAQAELKKIKAEQAKTNDSVIED
jgi:TolA-binding protein